MGNKGPEVLTMLQQRFDLMVTLHSVCVFLYRLCKEHGEAEQNIGDILKYVFTGEANGT
jgi:hypothetical protein